LTAGIKDIHDARVGDTVTDPDHSVAKPLPGYRHLRPMVYCGLYPQEANDYNLLRESLEKLQLNDAALVFEPETSVALGFGFRCGFLGCFIWRLFRNDWNANLTPTLSLRHRTLFMR